MKDRSSRWWLSNVVVPAGFVVAVAAVPMALWERLPDSVARHWDASGVPDGWSPKALFVALVVGFAVVAWSALISIGIRQMSSKSATLTVYFVMGLLLAVTSHTVWVNLDLAPDEVASGIGFVEVAAVIGVATLAGALGWLLSEGDAGIGSKASGDEVLMIDLDPSERAVWLGGAKSTIWTLVAVILVAAAVILRDPTSVALIVVALLMLLFSATSASVTGEGVTVGAGPWGWPNKRIPLTEIARAEVLDVEPMAFGGWGLRFRGLGDNRTAALISRKGPGLRLVRPDKADIVVTVDSPSDGVGLINALIALEGEPTSDSNDRRA